MVKIETVKIDKINPARYNPRKDLQPGDIEYDRLKKSVLEFDMVEPLVWNEQTGNLVGGHQRLKILKELGHTEVEVSVVNLAEAKEKALNIALNKIQGEWDMPKLKDLLEALDTSEPMQEVEGLPILGGVNTANIVNNERVNDFSLKMSQLLRKTRTTIENI